MEWIFNDGGPVVLLPQRLAAGWHQDGPARYKEACKGLDTFKVMDWQGEASLVLKTEGGQITWVNGKEGGCFVAWVYASPDIPDELVVGRVLGLPDESFEEQGTVLLPEREYVLMAAAGTYPEGAFENLPVLLPPGRYGIGICREMTFEYKEQPAEFYVIRLKRLPQG